MMWMIGSPGCDGSKASSGSADLPLTLRMAIVTALASTSTQSRERIEFQVDFLRTLKGGRTEEVLQLSALAASASRCAPELPDPAFSSCFADFDFMHLKLIQKAFSPAVPDGLLPRCRPHLANCHDMTFTVDDQAGHVVKTELGQVCRYHGKYWIFGKLACSRRQSDSNR